MMHRLLPVIAFFAFCSVPLILGVAEESPKTPVVKEGAKEKEAPKDTKEVAAEVPAVKKPSSHCLASEEIIQDIDGREKKLKEREEALKEKEKELAAQKQALDEELAKLDAKRNEFSSGHQKELNDREEQVNKLIETFEGMSPKSAAQVIAGVDDELAVMALTKLSSAKSGKILGNLKADKSARLSEMMAYGKPRKETARGESDRNTASSTR